VLRKLGLSVGYNPFVEGSDSSGFLVALDRSTLTKARTILRKPCADDNDGFDATLETLKRSGVYEIIHDWTFLAWEMDVPKLRRLGLRLKQIRDHNRKGAGALTFNVSRLSHKEL
jgi:hypothetical protein